MMTLRQAEQWIASKFPMVQLRGDANLVIDNISTDTRTLQSGALFVALQGEHFDGHNFLNDPQLQKLAAAVMVNRELDSFQKSVLIVPNTLQALGALAAGWRNQFKLALIAVTGSNGKTTVKEMIAAILAATTHEKNFLATRGNLNNEIGVPLTLLRLNIQHEYAVVELGMNHPGEITTLAHIVQPSVGLVNNAQREHQEFMHTVEAVARENGCVISALPKNGIAIFPADDAYTSIWRELAGTRQIIDFALQRKAAVTGYYQTNNEGLHLKIFTPIGILECQLHTFGEHNARNALAATACALAIGIPLDAIRTGLMNFQPVKGRLQYQALSNNITLIDDTYNANPDSVRAAIDVLAHASGPRLLILGDMGEVGTQGPEFHREIGRYAQAHGIETFFAIGALMQHAVTAFGHGASHFNDAATLLTAVREKLHPGVTLLVKGSRFMHMEHIVTSLIQKEKETY